MKIYTKTGDDGTTGLFAGGRVPKDHPRIAAYGSVDELNALLGLVAQHAQASYVQLTSSEVANTQEGAMAMRQVTAQKMIGLVLQALEQAQHDLFAVGAELATPNPSLHGTKLLKVEDGKRLEAWIDQLDEQLDPLTNFIVPGGSLLAGWLHWARTVCRRAEREVVHMTHQLEVEDCTNVILYLNRLSDLLFVMARAANRALGVTDVPWRKTSG